MLPSTLRLCRRWLILLLALCLSIALSLTYLSSPDLLRSIFSEHTNITHSIWKCLCGQIASGCKLFYCQMSSSSNILYFTIFRVNTSLCLFPASWAREHFKSGGWSCRLASGWVAQKDGGGGAQKDGDWEQVGGRERGRMRH